MMMTSITNDQRSLVEKFILEFLPQRGNKRKNTGNELDYVSTTLDRVFKKYFGFGVNIIEVLKIFEDLGYQTYTKGMIYDPETKSHRPGGVGNVTSILYSNGVKLDSPYTYIDVSAETMRYLRKTTAKLPDGTNLETVGRTKDLKARIEGFKKSHLNNK